MRDRYVAFDVETPNYANDRMSAIGVAVIENGEITEEFYSLVNPETRFDRFNIELTGITPEMAAGTPTFPELWDKLGPLMDSGLLAAHNAPFDLSVLAKCLRDYGVRWRPPRGLYLPLPVGTPTAAGVAKSQAEHAVRIF